MVASTTFSSARNVRSITAPVRTFFNLVRTNAPPLPGFTCWNSTTLNRPSGSSRVIPFRRSLVVMATRHPEVLGERSEGPASLGGDDDGVFDPNSPEPRQIGAGLYRRDRP